MRPMPGHTCYHCKQFVEEGGAHDCWTTTESALLEGASEDLRDAYDRLRETAEEFGEQRVYASHHCIMFARKACYFFVRPKRDSLELCVFLGRAIRAPQIKKAVPSSKTKTAHIIRIRHRDEVEAPITEWLREAYGLEDAIAAPLKQVKKTAGRRAKTATKQKQKLRRLLAKGKTSKRKSSNGRRRKA
jgi:hypothetical protein